MAIEWVVAEGEPRVCADSDTATGVQTVRVGPRVVSRLPAAASANGHAFQLGARSVVATYAKTSLGHVWKLVVDGREIEPMPMAAPEALGVAHEPGFSGKTPMSRGLKIFLILGGGVIVVGGVIVIAVVLWFRSLGSELAENGKRAQAEAQTFGASASGQQCIDESLRRTDACDGILCEAEVGVFLQACLRASPSGTDVCVGVPSYTDIMKSATWQVETCRRLGRANAQACGRALGNVEKFCAEDQTRATP